MCCSVDSDEEQHGLVSVLACLHVCVCVCKRKSHLVPRIHTLQDTDMLLSMLSRGVKKLIGTYINTHSGVTTSIFITIQTSQGETI